LQLRDRVPQCKKTSAAGQERRSSTWMRLKGRSWRRRRNHNPRGNGLPEENIDSGAKHATKALYCKSGAWRPGEGTTLRFRLVDNANYCG
jgi:hypothetical protein